MSLDPLSASELEVALNGLEGWEVNGDCIERKWQFRNFREAMAFLMSVSYEAEEMDHHPEIYCVYNRVCLQLSTHDVGGKVTERDIKLAQKIDAL